MKALPWIIAALTLGAGIIVYSQRDSNPSLPSDTDPSPLHEVSTSLPKPKLLFDAKAETPSPHNLQQLKAMGWSFRKELRNGATIRAAQKKIVNDQGIELNLFYLQRENSEPKINIRIFRPVPGSDKKAVEAALVPNTIQLVTHARHAPASYSLSDAPSNLPRLTFSLDERGFVLGDIPMLIEALSRDTRIDVAGYSTDDPLTRKQRAAFQKAFNEAKEANQPITEEIRGMKPPAREMVSYSFTLTGWKSAIDHLSQM